MVKKIDTLVISAFPACGKTYCFNNHQDSFNMLDSDSSDFSWVKDENRNNTKERNPLFPNNYIKHIKDNIGKVNIIFVSSHEIVRESLNDNHIKTILVYPDITLKSEWLRRFKARGNNEGFISFISDNWDEFINDMDKKISDEDCFTRVILENKDSYIDLDLLNELTLINAGNNAIVKINDHKDFINNLDKLPAFVLQDIDKRISDWLSSGGSVDDNYIKQQYRYAENVINSKKS